MEEGFRLQEARIAIIGLGLMGGSLALALNGKCAALYGVDSHRPTLELALEKKTLDQVDDDPAKLIPLADLVILAAPVPAILTLLDQLPKMMPGRCIVMDIGSTKQMVTEAMARLPERFDPIGGHPICGKEKLSLANAEQNLYHGAPFVLTPLKRTTPRAFSAAHQIIEAIGARAVIINASDHDRSFASTSHLPFLLSSALALATPEEAASCIGPGFRSATRLAGTPSSMMLGVLQSNRENILDALHRFQSQLAQMEAAMSSGDFANLEQLLLKAQRKYQIWHQ